MKKYLCVILSVFLLFNLTACSGVTLFVKTRTVDSEIYTQKDIDSAIEVIKDEFKGWSGCTLKEIYYAGDDVSNAFNHEAEHYNADEVIVLLSSFYVDHTGGDGSLNANSTYDNWNWILIRNKGEAWRHIDHGYY